MSHSYFDLDDTQDHGSSQEDAELQRALRILHSGPSPDFASRVASASPDQCNRAAARAAQAEADQRWPHRAGPLLYAAIVILGVGVTSYLMAHTATSRDSDVATSVQDPQDLRQVHPDPRRQAAYATWARIDPDLDNVRAIRLYTKPCYRVTSNSFQTSPHLTLGTQLDQNAVRELIRACRAAKPSDGGFPNDDFEYWWFEFEFDDGRWTKVMALPAKTPGHMRLTLNVENVEVRLPASVLEVTTSMTGERTRRWVRIRSEADIAGASTEAEAVLFRKASSATIGRAFARMPAVQKVEMRDSPLTHVTIDLLAAQSQLEELSLAGLAENVQVVALTALSPLTKLRRLKLDGLAVDPGELARLPALRDLTLSRCQLADPGLELLAQMPLQTLALRRMEGHGERALASLANTVRLRSLELEVASIEELMALAKATESMPNLQQLHVRFPRQFDVANPRQHFSHLQPAKTFLSFTPDKL